MEHSRERPIITLTTDFGLLDHYVGTMKGVLVSRCPQARLVDISHDIPAFSILAGAYTIDQAARYFPERAVHLVVIDPGVGTARRAIVARVSGQVFVAPDNGVLSLVLQRERVGACHEITNRDLWLPDASMTFHGRDVFAPTAAALACGMRVEDVGPEVNDIVMLEDVRARQIEDGSWQGRVLSIDRFGNAITNFDAKTFARIADAPFQLALSGGQVTEFRNTFGEAGRDLCFAYFGSSGYVEVGMNQASAAGVMRISIGDSVTLRLNR